MRIIGIDPGIRITGYGIIDIISRSPVLVDYGIIKPPAKGPVQDRLSVIYNDLSQLIETQRPEAMAIEDTFYGVNPRSALVLGQARGAALLCAAHHRLPVAEYAPRKVKLSATGNGRASKKQVQAMVQRLLAMDAQPEPQDASDALAVALCHFRQSQFEDLLS